MKIKENPCKHPEKCRGSQREGSGVSGASPGKKKRLTRKKRGSMIVSTKQYNKTMQETSRKRGVQMIEIKNLTKVYRLNKKQMMELKTKDPKKTAVGNLSFQAKEGEIYGLLGPNGAGKTTTLRCIATLIPPTEGEIYVNGYEVQKEPKKVRTQIGFLTSDIKLDEQFTVDYMFDFFGRLHEVEKDTLQQRKEELFSYFGIEGFAHKQIKELSTGMKQKAAIAVSLVHDPRIVIFDEPTNGLDIITARGVTDYLKKLRNEGKLIVVSTHIMSEAQKLCDRIGIIVDGEMVAEGTVAELLQQTGAQDLEDAFFEFYREKKGE